MAFDFASARLTAVAIIANFGGDASIVSKGSSGGFSQDGSILADTADTEILGKTSPLMSYENNEVDGKSIIMGDSFIYFQSITNAEKIEIDMQITLNNKTFKIKNVEDLSSIANVNVYYKLQLRK